MSENKSTLIIDEAYRPIIYENECEELKPVMTEFMNSYVAHKDSMKVEDWLTMELHKQLPDVSEKEIKRTSNEIINSLRVAEEKKESLNEAISQGRSKENWFASETVKATSSMSAKEVAGYMNNLDRAVSNANESLQSTITTLEGKVSQNPCLDGFIAEQYHAQTFNMNAEANGSQYRAKVLEPGESGYSKNSVDIVIVDVQGKIVKRYQSKYCQDAKATQKAFEDGNYRGQRKLVPEEQASEVQNASGVIEAPDGTTSNPLSKSTAGQMRDEAQSGNWNELNWNEYQVKDLARGIGQRAGYAALQGAMIGVGFDIAEKVWNDEPIDGEEVVKTAIVSGTDFGVKAATAGALKVGAEKGIITVIPKGTSADTIANIVFVAIEDIKIIGKFAAGEYTLQESYEALEETTVSTTAGIVASIEGTEIGAAIGSVFGPAGMAVGGFVGGTVGYMAGSKIGQNVIRGAQKIRNAVCEKVKEIGGRIRAGVQNFKNSIKDKLLFLA